MPYTCTVRHPGTCNSKLWIKWNRGYWKSVGYEDQKWSTTIASASTQTTWEYWQPDASCSTQTGQYYTAWDSWNVTYHYEMQQRELSALEIAQAVAAREQRRIEIERASQRAAEAAAVARELLLSCLDEEQRREYDEQRQFHVTSSRGRRFCIKHGRAHNVFLVDDAGTHLAEFCGHIRDGVPNEDNVLAQKLLLEHDEDEYLRHANRRELVQATT